MSKCFNISDESYKKFQAALILTGENEDIVVNRLIDNYSLQALRGAIDFQSSENLQQHENLQSRDIPQPISQTTRITSQITSEEQRELFMKWFRGLTRNGRPYNPVTISGYTGRIENACKDPIFETIPVKNLFTITDLDEFSSIQRDIKRCAGYAEFDARSHNGFTAALRKYEEFLKVQASNTAFTTKPATSTFSTASSPHRWTAEEDEICCKRFIERYVIKREELDTVQFLQELAKEVPDVSEGSLRMKVKISSIYPCKLGLRTAPTLDGLVSTPCNAKTLSIK